MKLYPLGAQLEFLAWRDAQFAAISMQLEEAFPVLLDRLTAEVEAASKLELVRASAAIKQSVQNRLTEWTRVQLGSALVRAESDFDQTVFSIANPIEVSTGIYVQIQSAVPLLTGVGLIGASIAAIPTVVSFATVSTSVLAFWGTATVSWPLFAVGATGIAVATLAGSRSLQYAVESARRNLCFRLHREAAKQVFGIGRSLGERCILNDIQAAVLKAGQAKMTGDRS